MDRTESEKRRYYGLVSINLQWYILARGILHQDTGNAYTLSCCGVNCMDSNESFPTPDDEMTQQ